MLTCITQKFDDGTIWSPIVSVYIRNKKKEKNQLNQSFYFAIKTVRDYVEFLLIQYITQPERNNSVTENSIVY